MSFTSGKRQRAKLISVDASFTSGQLGAREGVDQGCILPFSLPPLPTVDLDLSTFSFGTSFHLNSVPLGSSYAFQHILNVVWPLLVVSPELRFSFYSFSPFEPLFTIPFSFQVHSHSFIDRLHLAIPHKESHTYQNPSVASQLSQDLVSPHASTDYHAYQSIPHTDL